MNKDRRVTDQVCATGPAAQNKGRAKKLDSAAPFMDAPPARMRSAPEIVALNALSKAFIMKGKEHNASGAHVASCFEVLITPREAVSILAGSSAFSRQGVLFNRYLEGSVPIEQFVTNEQLQAKMQVVLQTWPLYRTFNYTGADQIKAVPQYLSLFCDNCKKDTFWETHIYGPAEDNKQGFAEKQYKCRNCANRAVTYYFYWARKQNNTTLFFKVGQYPELEERVSDTLADALSTEDLKVYKNALRMRNFNLGIAAVAYMRRVVENRMSDMLEVLHEAARVHNAPPEVLARHEEMLKEKRFSERVNYAGDLLPESLRPKGQPNPMAILHELASDGLHAKTDEECVDIFDACRKAFEYVFGRMRLETEEAKNFVEEMAKLAAKKGT